MLAISFYVFTSLLSQWPFTFLQMLKYCKQHLKELSKASENMWQDRNNDDCHHTSLVMTVCTNEQTNFSLVS